MAINGNVTAAVRKLVASLDKARNRAEHGIFVAEGSKCVLDTLGLFDCVNIIATPSWINAHAGRLASVDTLEASRADMERMTHFSTAPDVIALYRIPHHHFNPDCLEGSLTLALDRIQDPGNLGTIVRLADWFGIHDIVCSPDTVDIYNPKVVQATMGAIARVRIHYMPLVPLLSDAGKAGIAVCGTFLDGTDIYSSPLPVNGSIIVMGNEGAGVSDEVAATVDRRLLIPSYPPGTATVESLNVAIATAITVSEFRRQSLL